MHNQQLCFFPDGELVVVLQPPYLPRDVQKHLKIFVRNY